MHVLFTLPVFLPHHSGGMEVYFYGLAQELRCQDVQVSILTGEDPAYMPDTLSMRNGLAMDQVDVDGLPVWRLFFDNTKTGKRPPWYNIANESVCRATVSAISRLQPDIVHGTSTHALSASVYTAARETSVPYLITLVDYSFLCPLGSLLRPDMALCTGRKEGLTCLRYLCGETRVLRTLSNVPTGLRKQVMAWNRALPWLGRLNGSLAIAGAVDERNRVFAHVLRNAGYLIAPSRFLRQIYVDSGIVPADQIVYSPHGHNLEHSAQGAVKTPADHIRFGFTGHMLPYKGVDILIRAFCQLPEDCSATLELHGDPDVVPEYGMRLRCLAADHPRIHFHGRFENRHIGEVLSSIDVMVMPSIQYENAPVTIAEAFAARTPVIATNLGGMVEMVQHEMNGLLFERGDVDDLVRQLRRLIETPDLLAKLKQGIPTVRTIEDEVNEIMGIYRELIDKHPRLRGTGM